MPLRDHFRPPLDDIDLVGGLPRPVAGHDRDGPEPETPAALRRRAARPLGRLHRDRRVRLRQGRTRRLRVGGPGAGEGGVATAAWAPPRPTFDVATDLPDQDEYEVRVYDTKRHRRLVAAVEIVSPANKDRPENRRAFVAKCAALLQQRVSVAIVDLVTTRQFNLYGDLLELIGQTDPALAPEPPSLYAAACRWTRPDEAWRFQTWTHALALGRPLPTLPLWLADDLAVPLELEASYEETCRILRLVQA